MDGVPDLHDVAGMDAWLDSISLSLNEVGRPLASLIAPRRKQRTAVHGPERAPALDATAAVGGDGPLLKLVSAGEYFRRFREWPGDQRALGRYSRLV